MPDFWIQLENHAWDTCPNNIDRMTGLDIQNREGLAPVKNVSLTSPGTSVVRNVTMFRPLMRQDGGKAVVDEALILRRYRPPKKADKSDAWTVPDDRKVNPWDLNEPDPTDNGTMGTIPGPVIECNVGDSVIVHFRNLDNRLTIVTQQFCIPLPFGGQVCIPIPVPVPFPIEKRAHSLHPHGFVFAPTSDGAYPLSPPDPSQLIPPSEKAAWASVGVKGQFKQGDRVPPGGTFDYTWNTLGWPTTAGVWLYHDHSVCDMDNVEHGAIGIVVIHNPNDTGNEVDIRLHNDPNNTPDPAFLPKGTVNASPIETICFPFPQAFPFGAQVLPHDLAGMGVGSSGAPKGGQPAMSGMPGMSGTSGMSGMSMGARSQANDAPSRADDAARSRRRGRAAAARARTARSPRMRAAQFESGVGPPVPARTINLGNAAFEVDDTLQRVKRICVDFYVKPPSKALYLQLFHTLGDASVCINGRKYLGNTPTLIARPRQGAEPGTRMRFGVVGMGSMFHTFHIHGHRWILPGPTGTTLSTIQNSVQNSPVSQFEDTRAFGPANSFVFTIDEDSGLPSFFRAEPAAEPSPLPAIGEWHMHCHLLDHMMQGMMGSLLVVVGGTVASPLPSATLVCPDDIAGVKPPGGGNGGGGPKTVQLSIKNFAFPPDPNIHVGDTVIWTNNDGDVHSVTADDNSWDSSPGCPGNPGACIQPGGAFSRTFPAAGVFTYHCKVHTGMKGTVTVNP
jgi:plastocyanin/FtsP/CotA-like multicopper oxidase with cupredoxin domain